MRVGVQTPERAEVVVVGGGATGCATAHHLAAAGTDVVLIERHDLNTEASGRNAGSLHGQIQHEPFLHLGEDWARSFLPALRFLADSLELWSGLSDELGVDLEVKRNGGILVADDPGQLAAIGRKVELERSIGIDSELIDRAGLRARAPWVTERAVGGAFCPIEGKANSLLAAPAFAAAAERHGARIRTRTALVGLEREHGRYAVTTSSGSITCDKVVFAAGDALAGLGQLLGISLPISSEAVQVSVTEPVAPFVDHLVYYAGDKLTFKQASAGGLLIGGGWPARRDAAGEWIVSPDSLRRNIRIAVAIAPQIATLKLVRTWVGIGNGTPDHRPVLGEVAGSPGLFVGLFPYMGLTASPLMGRVLAALVRGEDPGRDLSPFDPARFSVVPA